MKMELFLWTDFIFEGTQYTIYALAEDIDKAKILAIEKVKSSEGKKAVEEHIRTHSYQRISEPDSFIFNSTAEL